MPQTPQECKTCLANGVRNQMIIFEQLPGLFKPDGKPKFKPVNPDNSKHEHKLQNTPPAFSAETRSPKQFEGVEDRSLETNTIIPSSQFDKEEYFRRKEEKYDNNVEEYKQWQADIKNIAKQTLEAIVNLNISIQAFLHKDEVKPIIQKASAIPTNEYTKALQSTEKQHEAWDELHDTIEGLGLSEDRPQEEENEDENDENPERQGGYPE